MSSENPERQQRTTPAMLSASRAVSRYGGSERPNKQGERGAQDDRPSSRSSAMRGSNPLVAVLQSAINPMESASKIRESLALTYWSRAAGPQAAAASEAECVRDGILFVRTKSSVWSHELTLYKSRLLLNLNRLLGGKIITDIVFRAKGVSKPEPVSDPDMPTLEELAAVVLEPEEKAELRARLQALISIQDDHVRHGIASRLMKEAKLRHWRLEHGWRICPRCDALHKTPYRLCPICRLSAR